eukprot:COSAG02_NODE_9426_length_2220_cov_1.568128_2_plen_384_part_01
MRTTSHTSDTQTGDRCRNEISRGEERQTERVKQHRIDYAYSSLLCRTRRTLIPACTSVCRHEEFGTSGYGAEEDRPAWLAEHLEVKDWVVIKPGAAHATAPGELPVGSWVGGESGLLHIAEDALLKVPRECMGLDYLAYHASLATAYRLLEGYGVLRLGDCVIQNNADSAVGVAVIQLCRMLRLSCINVVDDTPRFEEVQKHLQETFGATIVLRDTPQLPSVIENEILPKWSGVHRPRLALDGIGAESGERLSRCLTECSPLVTYATRGDNTPPTPRPMVVLAGQISLHTFVLAEWVSVHGGAKYVKMLEELSELCNGMKLQLDLRVLDCTSQGGLCAHMEAVQGCLAVARGNGVAEPGSEFVSRPQLVLQLGTVRATVYTILQ